MGQCLDEHQFGIESCSRRHLLRKCHEGCVADLTGTGLTSKTYNLTEGVANHSRRLSRKRIFLFLILSCSHRFFSGTLINSYRFATVALGSDNFNRADGALGGNWTNTFDPIFISANRASITSTGTQKVGFAVWNTALPNNQFAELTYVASGIGSGNCFAVCVRASGSGGTLKKYQISIGVNATPYWALEKTVNGVDTTLATSTFTIAANDVFRIEVTGTTITAKRNVWDN